MGESFNLKDSPNDRVLNMMQGLEVLLNAMLEKDKDNKELAKYLGYVRKALEGAYDKLPQPAVKPYVKEQPAQALPMGTYVSVENIWEQWRQQEQAANNQAAAQR
jgi:hypothetical protein